MQVERMLMNAPEPCQPDFAKPPKVFTDTKRKQLYDS
jgi:hypothetical protein